MIDLTKKESHTVHFGYIYNHDEIIDEVIDGSYLELDEYINEHYR